jgi:hypothetical protein
MRSKPIDNSYRKDYINPHDKPVEEQLELDCYHKAEPDEPKFTLLARDPLSPWLVEMWAAMRRGDLVSSTLAFAGMVDTCAMKYENYEGVGATKINSAEQIAVDIRNFRIARKLT